MGKAGSARKATLLLLGVCLSQPTVAVGATLQREGIRDWAKWLASEHKKVARDCEELVELSSKLRRLAGEEAESAPLSDLQERIQGLAGQAQELQQAVQAVDVQFLSVDVVEISREMREESKALRKQFQKVADKQLRDRLRRLARQIEKKADAVYDRTRYP